MNFKALSKAFPIAPQQSIILDGQETRSSVAFRVNIDQRTVSIQTYSNFSRKEVFNLAMILIKLCAQMSEYKVPKPKKKPERARAS